MGESSRRTVRERIGAAGDRLDQRAEILPGSVGQVFQIADLGRGSFPTDAMQYFAAHPVTVGGPELEAQKGTLTAGKEVAYLLGLGPINSDPHKLPILPKAGDYVLAEEVGGRWAFELSGLDCDNPYLCFQFGDCGGPVAGVTVTLTPKDGGAAKMATSGADGKACFPAGLAAGDYNATYSVPDGYTAPEPEDIKVGRCGGTVSKLLYPAPGKFKLSPNSPPQSAPGSLKLTTPFSAVSLKLFLNYPLQQDGNTDYNTALLGWWGYEDGPSYTWTSVNPDGTIEQSCNVHNRIAYSIYYFNCGSFLLYWYMWRCFDGPAAGDPGFIPCGPSCFTPGPIGSATTILSGDFEFFQYGLAYTNVLEGGFPPNGFPASGYTRAQNNSPDGTIYINFGAAGSLFGSGSFSICGSIGSGPPGPPVGWCASMDAVIISTWHMTSLVNAPTNEPPANAQPVAIPLILTT